MKPIGIRLLRSAGILSLLTLTVPFASAAGHAVAASKSTHVSTQTLSKLGTTNVSTIAAGSGTASGADQYLSGPSVDQTVPKSGLGGNARLPADHVPTPAANAVASSNGGLQTSFNGLTHRDQRLAGTGTYAGTQLSLEPPDQGLCAGNGYVVEGVNNAMRVYDTSGNAKTSTVALSQFFQVTPEIIRSSPVVYGEFISDPKCYYDSSTQRWFLTELAFGRDPSTGAFEAPAQQFIAVSQTSNPTGAWTLFSFYTTDDGTNGTPNNGGGCPCFGDQPLIGADANGFYISTNEYPINGPGFNGTQLYAISKSALEAAAGSSGTTGTGTIPLVNHINVGAIPTPDTNGQWYSVQPATTPPGGTFATDQGGTEYFLSALQFFSNAPLDNRIATWALTNTSSLSATTPATLNLSYSIVNTETYGQPGAADQKPGPTVFGSTWITQYYGYKPAPEELLAANDDRMNQVVYANGELWSGVNTVLKPSNGPTRVGIAYFVVSPSVDSLGNVSGTVANQGYVAANQENVMFPSIGVNSSGQGVMSFTLTGPDYFPSAAYAPINATTGAGDIHIAGAGAAPDDGFTGYYPFGTNRTARWGDYSAAVADESGNVWLASEYIPNGPRTLLANWGTYLSSVTP